MHTSTPYRILNLTLKCIYNLSRSHIRSHILNHIHIPKSGMIIAFCPLPSSANFTTQSMNPNLKILSLYPRTWILIFSFLHLLRMFTWIVQWQAPQPHPSIPIIFHNQYRGTLSPVTSIKRQCSFLEKCQQVRCTIWQVHHRKHRWENQALLPQGW